jgi:methylase of polypeptide subunit release factors
LLSRIRDAGITLSCHLGDLLDEKSRLAKALLPSGNPEHLQVLELGAGCGMVGITIAGLITNAKVILSDLAEALEIVERNIAQCASNNYCAPEFLKLDWDNELPRTLESPNTRFDVIIAADCTYNADSR